MFWDRVCCLIYGLRLRWEFVCGVAWGLCIVLIYVARALQYGLERRFLLCRSPKTVLC